MTRAAAALVLAAAVLIPGCADHAAHLDPVSQRSLPVRPIVEFDGVEHAPYVSGDCAVCHDLQGSANFRGGGWPERKADSRPLIPRQEGDHAGRLTGFVGSICVACHHDKSPDTLDELGENVHAPVAKGECTLCHDPHRSHRRRLLRDDLAEGVCAGCHARETHRAMEGLAADGDEDCIGCHEPHGSVHAVLLKEPLK